MKTLDAENVEINVISLIKPEKLNKRDTKIRLCKLCHQTWTKNELPAIPQQSSFQPELYNQSKQSVLLEGTQVPLEA